MKRAVILAAGAGRRIATMGWTKPKCLLPCPGGTLLDSMLGNLAAIDVREVTVVVGFEQDLVRQCARRHERRVEFVENTDFATTNTAYSLALVRDRLCGDCYYLNADVWFAGTAIERLANCKRRSALLIDPMGRDDEAVKVEFDASGQISAIGKRLESRTAAGEFVGIGLFRTELCEAMQPGLRRIVEIGHGRDWYFERVLNEVLGQVEVRGVELAPGEAFEIDTPEDYREAQRIWSKEPG